MMGDRHDHDLGLWISGSLVLWFSGPPISNPDNFICGSLDFGLSGFLFFFGSLCEWFSGSLDLRVSGSLDLWIQVFYMFIDS